MTKNLSKNKRSVRQGQGKETFLPREWTLQSSTKAKRRFDADIGHEYVIYGQIQNTHLMCGIIDIFLPKFCLFLAVGNHPASPGKCQNWARFTSPPERPHPNCKCEIEFVGKMIQNKDVKNDIMERLIPYVAVRVTYRSKSRYADTYLEAFTSIPGLLPNDATQNQLNSAYEFAIHILDICHLDGNIPKDLVPELANIVAKEAVELALDGWTKDDIVEKLTIKAAQAVGTKILQQLLGVLGAGLGKILLYPSEANPLTPEEKRKMKQ